MTPIELREKGYQVLIYNLGFVDTIRFLQQGGWGTGDYTKERDKLLKNVTREAFLQDIKDIQIKKQ